MGIKKVVVAVDFSAEAELAAEHAFGLARRFGAALVLHHVGHVLEPLATDGSAGFREYRQLAEAQATEHQKTLAELCNRFSERGVEVTKTYVEGFPDEEICRAARDENADLLVMGTHGRTGVKRFLMGSVAEQVSRQSEVPVLITRPGQSAPASYRRLLVPTDFSTAAEEALRWAIQVGAEGAQIDLFHAWSHPATPSTPYYGMRPLEVSALAKEMAEIYQPKADALMASVAAESATIQFHSVQAAPATAIIDRSPGYDLVVMGSHGRRGVRRLVLGSVAETALRHTSCSALIVHPRPD